MLSNKELDKIGLDLLDKNVKPVPEATVFLDHDVFYVAEIKDEFGNSISPENGGPKYEVQTYRTAGSWISEAMADRVKYLEKEFPSIQKKVNEIKTNNQEGLKAPKPPLMDPERGY